MKPSTELFDLIKSLDKKEITYFRKASKGQEDGKSQYLELFEAILRQPEYDEGLLKNQFADHGLGSWFAVAKKYLYDRIIDVLDKYSAADSHYADHFKAIRKVEILYNKELVGAALKVIVKEENALGNDHQVLQLLLQDWKKRILKTHPMVGDAGDRRIEIDEKCESLHDAIQINHSFWRLLSYLMELNAHPEPGSYQRLRGDFREIQQQELIQQESLATTLEAKVNQLQSRIIIHHRLDEVPEMFHAARTLVDLLDTQSIRYKWDTDTYFFSLILLLNANVSNRTFDLGLAQIEKCHHAFRFKGSIFRSLLLRSKQNVFGQTLRHLVGLGLYEEAVRHFEVQGYSLGEYSDRMSSYYRLQALPCVSWAYFGMGEYSKANKFIQASLLASSNEVNFMTVFRAKIIELVVGIEWEGRELLPFLVENLRKWLENRPISNDFTRLLLRLARRLVNSPDYGTDRIALEEFQQKLTEGIHGIEDFDVMGLRYFDIEYWVESKLAKKSIKEIVASKYPTPDNAQVRRVVEYRLGLW